MVDVYLAELAGHRERPVGPVRAAEYRYLPEYWREAGRHPFFIVDEGRRVGFVLVREVLDAGFTEMSDFFVERAHRRAGTGRAALAQLWPRFPGRWELQVHPRNEAASRFWPRCIAEFAHGPVRRSEVTAEDGQRVQYEFEIAGG